MNSLPKSHREVAMNYIGFQATSIIKEITSRYFGRYSWQLENCLQKYQAEYSLPALPAATVINFCALIDKEYPLSTTHLVKTLAGQKLSEFQYNSALRRLVEVKRAGINLELSRIKVIYQPQEFLLTTKAKETK